MLLAFLMLAGACALVVVPLIGGKPVADREADSEADNGSAGGRPEPVATASVVIVLIALPVAAFALYGRLSAGVPDETTLTRAAPADEGNLPSVAEMAAALEQRLITQPDDQQGWQMLGRTYVAMQRFTEAAKAYEEALALSAERAPALLLDVAEAMAAADPGSLTAAAGELIEEALRNEPGNRKGLWYGGSAAFERGDYRLARDRWQTLAGESPPEALLDALNQRIAAANDQLGVAGDAGTVVQSITPGSNATGPGPTGGAADGSVAVSVTLSPELSGSISPGSPLFILARSTAGGPPLAVVRRRAGDLPLDVTLSDADAMIAGRTISSQQTVEIVARIALGGGPVASPGDLYGAVDYNVADGGGVRIVIDGVQP